MKRILFFLLLFLGGNAYSQDAVTLSNVHLRQAANTSSKTLFVILKGTSIQINNCNNNWCEVTYNDLIGYVSSKLITHNINSEGVNEDGTVNYYTNHDGNRIQSPTHYKVPPEGATAVCGDGTYSFSASRRGTCSHHGGVRKWL
jgi:uncharacterized protein YgiM (DUF1202 family)